MKSFEDAGNDPATSNRERSWMPHELGMFGQFCPAERSLGISHAISSFRRDRPLLQSSARVPLLPVGVFDFDAVCPALLVTQNSDLAW